MKKIYLITPINSSYEQNLLQMNDVQKILLFAHVPFPNSLYNHLLGWI